MIIQKCVRSNLITAGSKLGYDIARQEEINVTMEEANSYGMRITRVEDGPFKHGPLGNCYGYVYFYVDIDTDNPLYQEFMENSEPIETNSTSGGCYVATCVYGSYDCPQVWTLRRFRDNTLAATWYGRAFVRIYYAISPTLVKWFGNTKWFKNMWKPKLDRLVSKLRMNGVEDTPYNDKHW